MLALNPTTPAGGLKSHWPQSVSVGKVSTIGSQGYLATRSGWGVGEGPEAGPRGREAKKAFH